MNAITGARGEANDCFVAAVADDRHAATIELFGNYMAGSFATTAGGQASMLISGWDAKQINRLGMRAVPLIFDQFNGFVGDRAPSMSPRPNHHVGKCGVRPKPLSVTTSSHSFGTTGR